jgi:hypothetical protein
LREEAATAVFPYGDRTEPSRGAANLANSIYVQVPALAGLAGGFHDALTVIFQWSLVQATRASGNWY